MNIAFQPAKLAIALLLFVAPGVASPVITVLYDSNVGFTTEDKTQIQSAIDFFTSNLTSTFDVTIAFGGTTGGGAMTTGSSYTELYSDYYSALLAHSSGNATDTTAIASLGGPNGGNNPVTSTAHIQMTTTLASDLGLDPQSYSAFSGCDNLVATACIQVGTDVLNTTGSPMGSLMGTVEHEVDEVLGTSSALRASGLPADPSAADLFRYSAPTTRGFALNTATTVPCTGAPTAYFSIDSGNTNLNAYNNCNNGGDYGDWIYTDGLQVQDAFGPDSVPSSLNLNSPEVTLLDAVGYNFSAANATPEPSSFFLLLTGLAVVPMLRRRLAAKLRG